MPYPEVPEPIFDLEGWFNEVFPKPELFLPEFDYDFYGGKEFVNIHGVQGHHKKYYEQNMERHNEHCNDCRKGYKNQLREWKMLHHKYIETDYFYTFQIKVDNKGIRFVHFEGIDPDQDNWKNLYTRGHRKDPPRTWRELTTKYISCGEWDNPTFTENERLLAWRIECSSTKPKPKQEKVDDELDISESFNEYLQTQAKLLDKKPYEIKLMIAKLI